MKRLTLSILFATVSLSLASCTGPAGPVLPLRTGNFELTVEFTPKTGFNYACDGGVVSRTLTLPVTLSIDGSRYLGRPTTESGGDFALVLTGAGSSSAALVSGTLTGTALSGPTPNYPRDVFGDSTGPAVLSGTVLTPNTAFGSLTGPYAAIYTLPPSTSTCPNANGSWRLVAK
jgi:hypothetical protein